MEVRGGWKVSWGGNQIILQTSIKISMHKFKILYILKDILRKIMPATFLLRLTFLNIFYEL